MLREKKQVTYKGKPIRLTVDFSMESLKARGAHSNAFQTLKDHNDQHRLMCPLKLSPMFEGERKTSHDLSSLKKLYPRYTKYKTQYFGAKRGNNIAEKLWKEKHS